ncbi:MAG: sigma-70 family RNA polymerase sigma factor [Saprospiraceae bacterium]
MAEDIIKRVRSGITERNKVIEELYTSSDIDKAVIGTLIKMGCSKEMAIDSKTDAILGFIKSCYRPDFEIKSNVTNYLIGTAKYIWLNRVTKTKNVVTIEERLTEDTVESIEATLISNEKKQLLQSIISLLDEKCQQVLTLWASSERMKKIAVEMDYKSEGMARKKKHQCLQRLYIIVADHPEIKNELRSML